ncbi:MAG: 30S ribosomal protein S12 methylthiotransferase RimO [Bacteroidales bacterium]|jgi:ribosomal protein S12 methylthiotransferase|nr:30S ribosomal protein S12 methylthiotransferase RimO [Bacteroidales bacterium]
MKINIITLGCSKNSVDSEVIASSYAKMGHQVVFEEECPSNIVLVNTCCFIKDAKEESIEEIFHQLDRKNEGLTQKVYVVGCMAQRYKDELMQEIPEVDGFYNFAELAKLLENTNFDLLTNEGRTLSTPKHYAYLKISEGCNRRCSFCAIPNIRGNQISKPIDLLIKEGTSLANSGVKELILIAQDLTNYGIDITKEKNLDQLLLRLVDIKGIEWIRLHYAFPYHFPYKVLDVMSAYPQVCNYLDIPIQHVSEKVLQSMSRPSSEKEILQLIDTIRNKIPDITLRTTLLSGFPTEGKKEHDELVHFVEKVRFNRLGVFSYSAEEDTPAFPLGDPVKPKEKERRVQEIMELQEGISLELNAQKVASIMRVLTDSFEEEENCYIGRTEGDSPDVDNEVIIGTEQPLTVGNFYDIEIMEALPYSLIGEYRKLL